MILAWHYTTWEKYLSIVKDGVIRPATAGIEKQEKPVVWFSINQHWEPTANKGILDVFKGTVRTANFEEMINLDGGLVRLGVSPDVLLPWLELYKAANISRHIRKCLEVTARRVKSNPFHWFGAIGNMAIHNVVIEVMNESRQWVRIENCKTLTDNDLTPGQ